MNRHRTGARATDRGSEADLRRFCRGPVAGAMGVLLLAFLAGCAGLGDRLHPPRVQIAALELEQVKGLEAVFRVDLRVMNGNESTVQIRGVDCEVELNGEPFAAGVSRTEVTIEAFDTGIVPVTVYSSVIDMVRGIVRMPDRKELSYRISGRVRLAVGALPSSIPFSAEGILPVDTLRR